MLKHAVLAATFSIALTALTALPAAAADWTKVAEALGKPGTEMAGGVYRVGMPRTDLHVTLGGVEIKPTLALGSWLAFRGEGDMAMVMGDLVLTDAEVNPVMKKLEDSGSRSPRCTTTCCGRARRPSTCTSSGTATRPRWQPPCTPPSPSAERRSWPRRPPHRRRPSIWTPR